MSDHNAVATFTNHSEAQNSAAELRALFAAHAEEVDAGGDVLDELTEPQRAFAAKYGFDWFDPDDEPLTWGDGPTAMVGDLPHVVAVGPKVVLYHAGGTDFAALEPYFKALAAPFLSEAFAPSVSVLFKATADSILRQQLEAYFSQADILGLDRRVWTAAPPWKPTKRPSTDYNNETCWFVSEEALGFHLPMHIGDLELLSTYLTENGAQDLELDVKNDELHGRIKQLQAGHPRQLKTAVVGGDYEVIKSIAQAGGNTVVCTQIGNIYVQKSGAFEYKLNHRGGLYGVFQVARDTLLACGQGAIFRSENAGEAWQKLEPGEGHLFHISASPNGTLFIAGTGRILRSTDQGLIFTEFQVEGMSDVHFQQVVAVDDQRLFVGGTNGIILRTEDGGDSWQSLNSGVSAAVCRILAFGPLDAVFVGDEGVAGTTTDGGNTWVTRDSTTTTAIEAACIGNDGSVYGVTSDGNIIVSDDKGIHWRIIPTGISSAFCTIITTESGALLMGGAGGKLVTRSGLDQQRRVQK